MLLGLLRASPALAFVATLALSACADDPTNAGTSSVTLSFGQQSLNGDTVLDEAAIVPETFMESAHAHLGRDLVGLSLDKVVLHASGQTGLNGWSDLFKGTINIYLTTDSGDQWLAATVTAPAGFAALTVPVQVTREQLSKSSDALAGKLHVRLEAKSGRNPGDFFALEVAVALTFTGY